MATLRLAELIAPLAVASDGAAGLPPETSLRTALIGVSLGRVCGLDAEALGAGVRISEDTEHTREMLAD